MDRIVLNGIRATGRHGVGEDERSRPQEFEIDVVCAIDAAGATRSDDLGATIDYVRLHDIAVDEVKGASHRLLETLAERIAQRILQELRPPWVRVRATKLRPEGLTVPASIEIERWRSGARSISAPIELHVPDFAPAKRFYGGLGFSVAREEMEGDEGYLVMAHGADVLRFWPGTASAARRSHFARFPATSPPGYGVELVLTFDDVDAAYEQARGLGRILEPLRSRAWGLRDFRVEDPYGFYVRCTEPHDPTIPPRRGVTSEV